MRFSDGLLNSFCVLSISMSLPGIPVPAMLKNAVVSLTRALEIRQLFIARDFPPVRIEAVGRGERDLAVRTADEVAEPRNRRVTIEVR